MPEVGHQLREQIEELLFFTQATHQRRIVGGQAAGGVVGDWNRRVPFPGQRLEQCDQLGGVSGLEPPRHPFERVAHDVKPQPAITLELGFRKELVAGALMRKIRKSRAIFDDVGRLIAGQARLEVEDPAARPVRVTGSASPPPIDTGATGIFLRIGDRSDHTVGLAESAVDTDRVGIDVDLDAEVGAAFANRSAERSEREFGVLLRVADDDVPAAPAHQLVESEVVEVPAVGQVDELAARRRLSEQLGEQVPQRERRPRTRLASCHRGLPSHQPSRASKTVSRKAIGPDVE